jgi:hypothetical protein
MASPEVRRSVVQSWCLCLFNFFPSHVRFGVMPTIDKERQFKHGWFRRFEANSPCLNGHSVSVPPDVTI